MQYKYAYSYAQVKHILISNLKYPSVFIVLGVRLTKYQQIHSATTPAAQQMFTSGEGIVALYAAPNPFLLNKICLDQMFTSLFTYLLELLVPLRSEHKHSSQLIVC